MQGYGVPASPIETMANIINNTTKALIIFLIFFFLSVLNLCFRFHHPRLTDL
ncbi:hypothetical protein SBDP1_120019 [Syntrophobacter sp. SbD1]|nr:hypothetical protein SBDP1_120019 [Syntrophobacter sp. SbD1]